MSYATYVHGGQTHVGELDGDELVPLVGLTEIGVQTGPGVLAQTARDPSGRVAVSAVTLRPVVPNPTKVFCVGLNYHAHIEESRRELPTYPVLFPKYASSLLGADEDIVLPPESHQVDYEGELAVVIGRAGRRISYADAADHIGGYAVANDITMRDYQYKTHQWLQGKAWDRSTPLGPYLVTPAEADISGARITTTLNGEVVQDADLSMLIFDIPTLVSTISEFTTLLPGDVILTGTPSGVGYRREPQRLLADEDTVVVEIAGVGRVTSRVRAQSA
jgi:acylpyruvate hydrolase